MSAKTQAEPTAELFIELRCEELPARYVLHAVNGLRDNLVASLKTIPHGAVRVWATPRRIAVAIADVAAGRERTEKLMTGPSAKVAQRDGAWTKAAMGFARGKGVDVESLQIVDSPRGPVVAARVTSGGERTTDLVAASIEASVLGIDFGRAMRWGSGTVRWARPIHGVVALYDGAVIPCTVAGIASGDSTVGHRLFPTPFSVTSADEWAATLLAHRVVADRDIRRAQVVKQLEAAGAALGATVGEMALVDEVVDLVEWPSVVTATFTDDLLELPSRLLVESMGVHQRVFPLFRDGGLLNQFLVVSNHPFAATDPDCADTIARGNVKVLAARFNDAKFFYSEDRKLSLAEHASGLSKMRWVRDGGTMADKQARVSTLAETLAPRFGADTALAARAGALCKSDLLSQMVGEFSELQGHVGMLLARHDGEPEAVAKAIEEHYLPRFSSDAPPATAVGRATAAADRIDTLAGCFHLGLKPKGSADPLGLRRAAVGLLAILLDSRVRVQLPDLLGEGQHPASPALLSFVVARLRAVMIERYPTDIVDAVLACGDRDAVALEGRAKAMAALSETEAYGPLKETFKRLANITRDHDSTTYSADALVEDAERALHQALSDTRHAAQAHTDAGEFAAALDVLSGLKAPVDQLFLDVMVMDEDLTVRANRLSLVSAVGAQFRQIADFKHLS
jgi:glycyl-tRNA synthetase beta chain